MRLCLFSTLARAEKTITLYIFPLNDAEEGPGRLRMVAAYRQVDFELVWHFERNDSFRDLEVGDLSGQLALDQAALDHLIEARDRLRAVLFAQ